MLARRTQSQASCATVPLEGTERPSTDWVPREAIPKADHVNHRQPFQRFQPRTAPHFPQPQLFTLKLGFMSYGISILNPSTRWLHFKQTTIATTRVLIFSVCVIFQRKLICFCIVSWRQIFKKKYYIKFEAPNRRKRLKEPGDCWPASLTFEALETSLSRAPAFDQGFYSSISLTKGQRNAACVNLWEILLFKNHYQGMRFVDVNSHLLIPLFCDVTISPFLFCLSKNTFYNTVDQEAAVKIMQTANFNWRVGGWLVFVFFSFLLVFVNCF